MNPQPLNNEMPDEIEFTTAGVRGLHHIPVGARVFPTSKEQSASEHFSSEAEEK